MRNKRGITLVALVITIIILLILAGITITQLTEYGVFGNAKLAKEKYKNSQDLENEILLGYENAINDYVSSAREQIMVDKDEYTQLKDIVQSLENDVNELKNKNTETVLWTGSVSTGILKLEDSIYNYNFLVFCSGGNSAVVYVDKSGRPSIQSGSPFGYIESNGTGYWGFYISEINDNGKTLNLVRSGWGTDSTNWKEIKNITQIIGIK